MENLNQDRAKKKRIEVNGKVLSTIGVLAGILVVCVGGAWGIFVWVTNATDEAIVCHVQTQHSLTWNKLNELSQQIKEINQGILDLNIKIAEMRTDLKYLVRDRR